MRVFRYLGNHKLAVFLTLVVLICSVACDLALPLFTSQIVDVGIAQSGVEHIATERMSDKTHAAIAVALPNQDDALFQAAYEQTEDGTWSLTEEGGAHIAQLDSALTMPLVAVHATQKLGGNPVSFEQMLAAYESGSVTRAQVQEYAHQLTQQLAGGGELNQSQLALSAAMKEYAGVGANLSGIQMAYLMRAGLFMLVLTILSCVLNAVQGLIASRTGALVGRDLRRKLFERVVAFSEGDITRFSAASLITRGTNDIQLIQNVTNMILRMVLYAPIVALGGIIMVLYTNASLGWIIVVAVCVVACIIAGAI